MTVCTAAAAALTLLGLVQGHMVMNTPTPYNLHGTTTLLQVNPLGVGFPFPCQGATEVVNTTAITAGGSQIIKFTGGAQHGGGSCQFSVTYDDPPPADKSKWKTIYTLIGGCPVSAGGNLPVTGQDQDGRADAVHCGNDSGTECIRQFNVPIPKDLPNGKATFAWTWFNKIGNREIYMNCAPVEITGGADDKQFFQDLPDMFLANIPGECTTGNGVLNIPNPGKYGRVLEPPTPGSEGNCPKADGIPTFEGGSGGRSGSGSGSGSSIVASSAIMPSGTPAPNPLSSTAASSGFITKTGPPGGVFITVAPSPSPTTGAGSGSGSGSASPSGNQLCSTNGAIICFSSTSFGLCANGVAVPQPVAAGTTCNNGVIARRSAKFMLR